MIRSGTERLEEAVVAYRAALEEQTRDRVPLDWAMALGSIACVRVALFDKTNDAKELDRAQTAIDDAQAVFTHAQTNRPLAIAAAHVQTMIDARRGG